MKLENPDRQDGKQRIIADDKFLRDLCVDLDVAPDLAAHENLLEMVSFEKNPKGDLANLTAAFKEICRERYFQHTGIEHVKDLGVARLKASKGKKYKQKDKATLIDAKETLGSLISKRKMPQDLSSWDDSLMNFLNCPLVENPDQDLIDLYRAVNDIMSHRNVSIALDTEKRELGLYKTTQVVREESVQSAYKDLEAKGLRLAEAQIDHLKTSKGKLKNIINQADRLNDFGGWVKSVKDFLKESFPEMPDIELIELYVELHSVMEDKQVFMALNGDTDVYPLFSDTVLSGQINAYVNQINNWKKFDPNWELPKPQTDMCLREFETRLERALAMNYRIEVQIAGIKAYLARYDRLEAQKFTIAKAFKQAIDSRMRYWNEGEVVVFPEAKTFFVSN